MTPGADGPAALTDGEALLLLHRDARDELDGHLHVVARHHHLHVRSGRAIWPVTSVVRM